MKNNKKERTPQQKKEIILYSTLLGVIPGIGVILGIIAGVTKNYALLLLALPMMLTFFVSFCIIAYKGYKECKDSIEASKEDTKEDEEYEDYKGELNLSDEMILNSDNPYKMSALKAVVTVVLAITIPAALSYMTKDTQAMIGDLYVTNILSAASFFLGFVSVANGWKDICEYLDFNRAKKVLKSKEEGKKPLFVAPRVGVITLMFLFLLVVMFGAQFDDVIKLNEYKKNGVEVNAVICELEKYDDDYDVYFQYDYEGNQYTYKCDSYPGAKRIGNEVVAYLYPDKPDELFIYYSSAFAVYIMLGFSCFFLLMENGFKRSIRVLCMAVSAVIALLMGILAGAAVHIIFGVIMLFGALWTWNKA